MAVVGPESVQELQENVAMFDLRLDADQHVGFARRFHHRPRIQTRLRGRFAACQAVRRRAGQPAAG